MDDIFDCIIGEQLSSVTFVQDYLQLNFDGPCLTAYTWPVVEIAGLCYHWGEQDYRNQLCERIARIVLSVSVTEGDAIRIGLDDGAIIMVSLHDEDYEGPEAAMFNTNDESRRWNVW
jgi:hypothetical protein